MSQIVSISYLISISISFLVNFHSLSCLLSETRSLCLSSHIIFIHTHTTHLLSHVSACPCYFHSLITVSGHLVICRVISESLQVFFFKKVINVLPCGETKEYINLFFCLSIGQDTNFIISYFVSPNGERKNIL